MADSFSLSYRLRNPIPRALIILCLLVSSLTGFAQSLFLPPSAVYQPDRLKTVVITEVATGVAISAGLYFLWYRKHPRSHFHFFNDNGEWLQVDKIGHATTAYNIGVIQYDLMRWCGVSNNTSITVGGLNCSGLYVDHRDFRWIFFQMGVFQWGYAGQYCGSRIICCTAKRLEPTKDFDLKWSFHGSPVCEILSC